MIGTPVSYQDDGQPLEGYLVASSARHDLAGVLLVPTWLNVNESICKRADRLADVGYAVFVADLFGAGVRPGPPQSPQEVIAPLLGNRLRFRRRLFAGLDAFREQSRCDANRVAAIGYCLGGCGVLEMARAGAKLRGFVSLHGQLTSSVPANVRGVEGKVLVLHGDADPLVPFDQVAAFRAEMLSVEANWEINIYSNARHGFTGEGMAHHHGSEVGLHPQSESRSWRATLGFLEEVLR